MLPAHYKKYQLKKNKRKEKNKSYEHHLYGDRTFLIEETRGYLLTVSALLVKTEVRGNSFCAKPCILANNNPISDKATVENIT